MSHTTGSLVTIAITTHNRPQLLAQALTSAQQQTHSNVEIVVVDDGSSPAVEVLRDPAVRLVRHEQPRGVCAARNSALETARGDYVLFLDDDDQLPEGAVETLLAAIGSSSLPGPVAALGAIARVSGDNSAIEVRHPPTFAAGSSWLLADRSGASLQVHNALLAPTDVVRHIGGWDEELKAWVHDDFFLRLARCCSLQGVDRVTYLMAQPSASRAHVSRGMAARAAAMQRTLDKHRDTFAANRRRRAQYLGTIGITWLRAGDRGRAVRTVLRSWLADPRRAKVYPQVALCVGGPRVHALLLRTRGLPG